MAMNAVIERFAEQSPVTLMARVALQKALEPEWIDEVFEQESQRQYKRELLFSTTVELMATVAVGMRPSLNAAATACKDLPVSVQAVYDKIKGTEPALVRALVKGSAQQLRPVSSTMKPKQPALAEGFRIRIIDGSHLPSTEKRLKPLRGLRVGALPAQSLVVYDPEDDMVVDMIPWEDAHAQERAMTESLLERAQAGDLNIADRNFCTRRFLAGWHERECGFVVREHGSTPSPKTLGKRRRIGRIETGMVYEQKVWIEDNAGQPLVLRRVELDLDEPTEEGDTAIRMLTNLPKSGFTAQKVAQLYRRRWGIENMFQRLESVLKSEISSLGHPRAALLERMKSMRTNPPTVTEKSGDTPPGKCL
jgi:IS4 transposase